MEIFHTKEYDKFKIVVANREVNNQHVKKLAASIKKKNLLFVRPLIVNEKMEVIDGQHRLAACEQIGETVFYIKAKGLTKTDIAVLNTAQKNWTRLDFINFYAIEGKKEFKVLANLINKYQELKVSFILRAIGDNQNLRNGEITIINKDQTYWLCDRIREIRNLGYSFVTEKAFGVAFMVVIKDQDDFNQFRKRITKEIFYKCDSEPEYRKLLQSIQK